MTIRTNTLAGSLALAAGLAAAPAFAAPPPGYVAAVVAGAPDPAGKVPAFDAVPGAGVGTLSVADPVTVLQNGHAYTILVASQNGNFAGTCTTSYQLTQVQSGTTVTLASGKMQTYACAAFTNWAWALNTTALNGIAGAATLTGTVKFGATSVKLKVPVLIQ